MSSSTQVRCWQPCSSPACPTPPAQVLNHSQPWPKGTFAIKAAHSQHPEQPWHAGSPKPPCAPQAGHKQSLLGTGEHLAWGTRALPGDRVGQTPPGQQRQEWAQFPWWDRAALAPCATTATLGTAELWQARLLAASPADLLPGQDFKHMLNYSWQHRGSWSTRCWAQLPARGAR